MNNADIPKWAQDLALDVVGCFGVTTMGFLGPRFTSDKNKVYVTVSALAQKIALALCADRVMCAQVARDIDYSSTREVAEKYGLAETEKLHTDLHGTRKGRVIADAILGLEV